MEKSREDKREKETLREESGKDQTNTYNVLGEAFENYSDDLFTKRHKISFRTVTSQGQKIPADAKILAHQFLTFVTEKKIEYGITQVAKMDETLLWLDLPNPKSYDFRGIKTVKAKTTGHEKLRYTSFVSNRKSPRSFYSHILGAHERRFLPVIYRLAEKTTGTKTLLPGSSLNI